MRSAFAILREWGLIEVYPQRGTYITKINVAYIRDMQFVRNAVETAVMKEVMKIRDGLELGGVRKPLPSLIPEDMPHGDSLIRIADQIRELGFEGVDYLGTPEALDEFFTEEACRALGDHSRSIGLEPNVFVFQDASWNDACSEKKGGQRQALREGRTGRKVDRMPDCLHAGADALRRNPLEVQPRPHRRSSRDTICPPTTATRRTGIP